MLSMMQLLHAHALQIKHWKSLTICNTRYWTSQDCRTNITIHYKILGHTSQYYQIHIERFQTRITSYLTYITMNVHRRKYNTQNMITQITSRLSNMQHKNLNNNEHLWYWTYTTWYWTCSHTLDDIEHTPHDMLTYMILNIHYMILNIHHMILNIHHMIFNIHYNILNTHYNIFNIKDLDNLTLQNLDYA